MSYQNNQEQVLFRKQLRREATKSERLLWWKLKNNQQGIKFRRQFGIGGYIVDFYCHQYRSIIEIDGYTHENKVNYDKIRQDTLEEMGYKVIRYTDEKVKRDLDGVVIDILSKCIP